MKAITLWQPWATLWALQIKRNETRSWKISCRGPIAIHAAKGGPASIVHAFYEEPIKTALIEAGYRAFAELPRGCIIAVCDSITCYPVEIALGALPQGQRFLESAFGDYSSGRYAWTPINMRMLPEPIPARGSQGLWNWDGTGLPLG